MGALLIGIEPAEAGSRILCTGFTQCERRDRSDAGYQEKQHRSYWNAAAGTNCTNYVAYRLTHGRRTARPPGTNAASTWGSAAKAAGFTVNDTPNKGDIAWWASNVYPSKKKGHVAYVEAVRDDGSIVVSEDNMNQSFSWRKVTRGKGWPSGFIDFPESDGSPFGELTSVSGARGRVDLWAAASDPDAFGSALKYQVVVNPADEEAAEETWTYSSLFFISHRIRTVKTRGKATVTLYAYNRKGTDGRDKVQLGRQSVTIKD